jgi:hypothetical protein
MPWIIFLNYYKFRYFMSQVTADGRISSVKMFDDDMRAEIKLNTGGGVLTLKLTDNQQSAFSGMVALACGAMLVPTGIANPVHVTYDDDDREINDMEIHG